MVKTDKLMGAVSQFGSKGGTGLLVILTVSVEEMAGFFMFECPCDLATHFIYGMAYLCGPALILFFGALFAQKRFWRLMTGLFHRRRITYKFRESGEEPCFQSVWAFQKAFGRCLVQAAPMSVAWLLVGLLKGDFYACAFWPHQWPGNYKNCSVTLPTSCGIPKTYETVISSSDCVGQLARNLRSQSHLLAWYYGTFILIVAMLVFCFFKASSYFTYNQQHYIEVYRKLEQQEFDRQANEKALEMAKVTVGNFLSSKRTKKEWDLISQLKLGRLEATPTHKTDTFMKGKHFIYSPLHGRLVDMAMRDPAMDTAWDFVNEEQKPLVST